MTNERRPIAPVSLLLTVVFGLFCFSLGFSQNRVPMTFLDLLEVPSLRDPQLSPDGSQLVYVLSESDWEENRQIGHIWRVNTDGTNSVQMTAGKKGEQSPRWSPDGNRIAFLASREDVKQRQIFLLNNAGGEALQLTEHETAVSNIQWSPDGAFIYFLASDAKTKEEKKRDKIKDDVFAFDEDFKHRHLWKISVADRVESAISEGDFSFTGYRLSRDGAKVAFHRGPTPLNNDLAQREVWVMNSDGSDQTQITNNRVVENGSELSPDNQRILFLTGSNARFETYYNDNLFVASTSGGEPKMLLEEMPHDISSATWSKDGKQIYFVANTGVRSELFRVTEAGEKLAQLTKGEHSLRNWRFSHASNQHIFSINENTNAGDVWMTAARGNADPVKITKVFDYLSTQFRIPRQEAIQWQGEDGVTVEGLLVYPLDYEEGKAYPLVVKTHGGPASSDKFGFGRSGSYEQVFAAKGYAMLKPNYRGSTGYGDAFLRDMVGHYYNQAHLDVMTGVDYLIKMGIADGDRMVKMGWSAGGHMTNKIITHTDRFKAASSGAGAVNWISMYAQSDVRVYRTPWFGGTPWQKDAPTDVYWDNSPLKDIWKVTTPTLVLVGENDVRVPPPQSVELYRALKSNNVPTHLYIAPREPHGWRELRHRLFKMNVEMEWFEKYAMGREHVWEEAPEAAEEPGKELTQR